MVNLDKLTYAGNPENLRDVEGGGGYSFIHGDVCDRRSVDEAFSRGPEMVVNFAAETHVDRSILEPEAFLQTDIYGTFQLLEAVRRHDTPRYLQISTDEVYGSIESGSFTESSPIVPSSPYSASKAGADLLVRSYVHTYGTPAMIVRSSNNFGPYQYPEKVIPLFITNLLEGRKVPLYGDGLNVRDWLYVEDNCAAIDAVLRRGRPARSTTWAAAGRSPTWSSPAACWSCWARTIPASSTCRTAPATTAATPSAATRSRPWDGSRRGISPRPCAPPWSGTGTTGSGGSGSAAGSSATTT